MKTIFLAITCCLSGIPAFTQQDSTAKIATPTSIHIKVPDFANTDTKVFYEAYAAHLTKCIYAIREKNETKAKALFKNPGEQLVAREKELAKEVVKNAAEKKKYMEFAMQVYPYIKELEASTYFKKMYPDNHKSY